MDPIQAAENENMPKKASPSIDLTEDQRDTLFGPGGCQPGESYTITLKAGELGDSGTQTFEVVKEDEDEESPEDVAEDMAEDEMEEEESDESEKAMLGYDRKKMMSKRGKDSPKLDLKDLEY